MVVQLINPSKPNYGLCSTWSPSRPQALRPCEEDEANASGGHMGLREIGMAMSCPARMEKWENWNSDGKMGKMGKIGKMGKNKIQILEFWKNGGKRENRYIFKIQSWNWGSLAFSRYVLQMTVLWVFPSILGDPKMTENTRFMFFVVPHLPGEGC